jgi:thiamine biosynthesis lipoprotein
MTSAKKLVFLFFFVILSCNSSSKNNIDNIVSISGKTMGTTYNIKFLPKNDSPKEIEENYLKIET